MKKMLKLATALLLPGSLMAAEPAVVIPFDGTPSVLKANGEKIAEGGMIGQLEYVDGMKGKALVVDGKPAAFLVRDLSENDFREGTVSFFFRPNWERKDGKAHYLFQTGKWRSEFFLVFVKDARGQLELSVCTPKQRQVFVKNADLQPGKWVHFAFSWNVAKGECVIYIDGKPAARTVREEWKDGSYSFKAPWNIQLGRNVNEPAGGAYDNLKIYNRQLSDAEILADFSGK